MDKYKWHGLPWTDSGCPQDGLLPKGWYDCYRLIIGEFKSPKTNEAYTQAELAFIDCPECVVPPVVKPKPKPQVEADNSLLWIVGLVTVVVALYFIFVK
jgi:hypothetical protein